MKTYRGHNGPEAGSRGGSLEIHGRHVSARAVAAGHADQPPLGVALRVMPRQDRHGAALVHLRKHYMRPAPAQPGGGSGAHGLIPNLQFRVAGRLEIKLDRRRVDKRLWRRDRHGHRRV